MIEKLASRIINEVKGVNRCVLDITNKPPGRLSGSKTKTNRKEICLFQNSTK